jgi:ABC-type sugar transport system substrate-binding protein
LAVVGTALLGLPLGAMAQGEGGTKTARELRADYDTNVKNKTVAFLPIALGVPLQDEWNRVLKMEADWRGMKYVVRDPNNNPAAMQQALTALVNDKPDVLIVQNPSVTLLMKELKRAESQGTHVIQINMSSNYKSDAFVGADWVEVGRMIAEDVDTQCGTGSGKSGKVQIVQGELAAAASVDQIAGIMEVFNKDKAIKVVSYQAAAWDANNALNISSTVIQQHPDLCASVGFWGIMESGAAQAIRNAAKNDQVKVYASGEGSQLDCDQVNQGNFYKFLSYTATQQGHELMNAAVLLLQGKENPAREGHLRRIPAATPAITTNCAPICPWGRMRRTIGRSSVSVSSLHSRSSADFITNTAGRSFQQGQPSGSLAAVVEVEEPRATKSQIIASVSTARPRPNYKHRVRRFPKRPSKQWAKESVLNSRSHELWRETALERPERPQGGKAESGAWAGAGESVGIGGWRRIGKRNPTFSSRYLPAEH